MKRKIRYGNSVETMLADQKFKIKKSDDTYKDFIIDCLGNINSSVVEER